jgi:hypothetical protein
VAFPSLNLDSVTLLLPAGGVAVQLPPQRALVDSGVMYIIAVAQNQEEFVSQ